MYNNTQRSSVDVIQSLAITEDVASDIDFSIQETRETLTAFSSEEARIHFVSLSPTEKGFFAGVEGTQVNRQSIQKLYECLSLHDEKGIIAWINLYVKSSNAKRFKDQLIKIIPSGLPLSRVAFLQTSNYDYFEELKKQYKFLLEGQSSSNYSVLQSGEELNSFYQVRTPGSSVIFHVEGIYSLGIGNPEDEQSSRDISIGKVKSRVRQLKGEECLDDDGELKKWQHPPLMMRLAGNFGNGLFGHARSFSECVQSVVDQKNCLDKGVIKTSAYEIVRELLGLDEQLQPTGSKRILIDMAHLSASSRNDLYQKVFRIFNKNISPGHPIPVVFTDAAYSGVDYLSEMMKNAREGRETDNFRVQNYFGASINLSDEDILEVFRSHGSITLTLEEKRMGNEVGGFEKLFSNTPRNQAMRLLSRQLAGIIAVPFAYHVTDPLRIWNYLNIGNGLTGKGEMLERYRSKSFQSTLESDLEEVLAKLKKEEPMWFGSYKPDKLVKMICRDNMADFIIKNF